MSTSSRMSFGPTTPGKLNQSTESMYVPSHLFPTGGIMSAAMRDQEDTYLTLQPQRPTTATTTTIQPQRETYQTQTTKPQSDDSFNYYLSVTPYKNAQPTPKEKSPSGELPPAKSVYEVMGSRADTTFDTSMGEADTSMDRGGGGGSFFGGGASGIGGGGASGMGGGFGEDTWGASNRIDWDEDASRSRRGPVSTPFGASQSFFDQQRSVASPAPFPVQSPPFATSTNEARQSNQPEEIWLTIFGFPPTQAASNIVLKHFQELGDVVHFEQPIGVNWLHVCYLIRQHADRALAKNGKLIGEHMVGVIPRSDTANLPAPPVTIVAKDPSKMYDRNAVLLPPKEQSWIKSMLSFTFG